jgi:alpha-beta hydrolase superfamily lysophospholipase
MAPVQEGNQSAESAKSAEKVHLLGVSWGGKLALALAARYPERVASLTLSTPGLYSQRTVNFPKRLAIAGCALGWPTRRFAIPLNEPELFTDVDRWKKFIANDPLRLRSSSARFLVISQWMQHLLPRWSAAVRCPTLLLLADRDPIVDNARIEALLTSKMPADRLTIRRFPSAVHTLEFSGDPAHYFQTLVEWINQKEFAQ